MSKFTLKVYNSLCAVETFKIGGAYADVSDFGDSWDRDEGSAEPYSCGDMHFTPTGATQEVLDKYSITLSEYNAIARELEEKLSFGSCGWCA